MAEQGSRDTQKERGRRPQTYPAGSSRAGAPARRIMPLAARGWWTEGLRRRAARAAMPRAPACPWRWPSGRARAGAAAAARRVGSSRRRRAPGRSLPSTSCIGASGSFRKRLALVVKGSRRQPLGGSSRSGALPGHTEARAAAPPGPGLAAGGAGPRRRARAPNRRVLLPPRAAAAAGRLRESRAGNLEKSLQFGEDSGRKEGAPCSWRLRPRTGRWGGRELVLREGTRGTGSRSLASRPKEPQNQPRAAPD